MDILNRFTVTLFLLTSFSLYHLNAQRPKVKFAISHCNDISGQVVPFEVKENCPIYDGSRIYMHVIIN